MSSDYQHSPQLKLNCPLTFQDQFSQNPSMDEVGDAQGIPSLTEKPWTINDKTQFSSGTQSLKDSP